MKKLFVIVTFICALFIMPIFSEASVTWDGSTIEKGQIGKITVVQPTKMTVVRSTGSFQKNIKKGETYRVFSIDKKKSGNVYNLGGGKSVKVSKAVKYKAIPAKTRQALGVKYTIKNYKLHDWILHEAKVAQVSGLINKKHEDSINRQLRSGRMYVINGLKQVEESLEYDFNNDFSTFYDHYSKHLGTMSSDRILSNKHNYFSVESTIYCGSCTSARFAWTYASYNLLTGKKAKLSDFVKTTAQKKKLRSILIAEAKKRGISANDLEVYYNYYGVSDYRNLPYESAFYVKDQKLYFMFYIYAESDASKRIFLPVSISTLQKAK
ncbi:MAG: hypothetical protein ABS882_05650 [Lysinibacillus sp.]